MAEQGEPAQPWADESRAAAGEPARSGPPPGWSGPPPGWSGPPPGWSGPPPGWSVPPPGWSGPPPGWQPVAWSQAVPPRRSSRWRWLTARLTGWAVAAALAGVVVGLAVSLATSPPTLVVRLPGLGPLSPGFGVQLGPLQGVVSGTVSSISSSSFTMTTASGRTVTVREQSSTRYEEGGAAVSRSAVTAGSWVIVAGSRGNSTITATLVLIAFPAGVPAG